VTTGEKDLYHLRDAFCAPPGCTVVVADWAALEYRLLAHFSQEPKLIKLFLEGWDLHSLTCYNIYPQVKEAADAKFGEFTVAAGAWIAEEFSDLRKKAKVLNFEIIYGVGARKLAEQLGITVEEAQRMLDSWFAGYPYVKAWQLRQLAFARQNGYVRLIDGRFRHPQMDRLTHYCQPGCRYRSKEFPDRRCGIRGEEERTIQNAFGQGSGAVMAKRAMIKIHNDKRLKEIGYVMAMQIHDEILGYCPIGHHEEAKAIVKQHMENVFSRPLRVPMPVAVGHGPTWGSGKA
jgi:DNA polymerase I